MLSDLQHDVAVNTSFHLVEMIVSLLGPNERQVALEQFYAVIRAALETYEEQIHVRGGTRS
jgi:hypothetical protein